MRTVYPYIDPGWSERRCQHALANWCLDKGHAPVVPNCGVFGWEADLLSVTDAGFVHEFEVKISVEDFRADAAKRKHKFLGKPSKTKYGIVGPVYFWYAVPLAILDKVEPGLPDTAGLLVITPHHKIKTLYLVRVIRPAPRLHSVPIRENDLAYLYRGLTLRYWKRDAK